MNRSPWSWIPSLYYIEAMPNVIVVTVAVFMYNRLGWSNAEVALYTSILAMPWGIKFLWSPFVEQVSSKRTLIVICQMVMALSLAWAGYAIPHGDVRWTCASLGLLSFTSATHDIAADGFYIDALSSHAQALFVGVRSTFYRIAAIVSGALTILAGMLETFTHNTTYSWSVTFYVAAAVMVSFCVWHVWALPKVQETRRAADKAEYEDDGFRVIVADFFRKPQIVCALLFMLLYRMPEGLLSKVCPLFLLDSVDNGGMGLTTSEAGFVQGTIGVIGLTIGGIIGGIAAAQSGLKRWLWPMVAAITLPDIIYVVMSYYNTMGWETISVCVFIEQFGYGFGFTAYMLYLLYYAHGRYSTAHYAICTSIMAWSLYPVGMVSGWLQEQLGYRHFFLLVTVCCAVTFAVSALVKIDPEFGKKKTRRPQVQQQVR